MKTALGIHVFAGGFTKGVQQVHKVNTHLETHGFALDTARTMCNVDTINCDARDWPKIEADWVFGNPRCTGFSCITSGYDETAHGAWSKPTIDIHELCEYGVKHDYEVICWESVQQAYTTGSDLLAYLRDKWFVPNGYRIAHLFINAASMGNAQARKRYFFLAYKGDKNFNIVPPEIPQYSPTVYDAYWDLRNREGYEYPISNNDGYDHDAYTILTPNEKACLKRLPNGWGLNKLAKYGPDFLPPDYKTVWLARLSEMPFSMHCICRLSWLYRHPTLSSSCTRFIHPDLHRPLTVGELARAMGWGDDIPVGKNPGAQIAKGVVPSVGTWLAEQVDMYLDDAWGDEDWESSYDDGESMWVGEDAHGKTEKVFNLTRYVSKEYRDVKTVPYAGGAKHRFNLDSVTGTLIVPWDDIRKSRRRYA